MKFDMYSAVSYRSREFDHNVSKTTFCTLKLILEVAEVSFHGIIAF